MRLDGFLLSVFSKTIAEYFTHLPFCLRFTCCGRMMLYHLRQLQLHEREAKHEHEPALLAALLMFGVNGLISEPFFS